MTDSTYVSLVHWNYNTTCRLEFLLTMITQKKKKFPILVTKGRYQTSTILSKD